MALSDFKDCMNDTVVLHPFVERNSYGEPSYGTPISIGNCRVVYKDFWLRKVDGSEVNAKGIVWLGLVISVTVEDKFVLPDGTDHPVLMAESYPDELGMHHTKVILG